jgi:hypothetical protein
VSNCLSLGLTSPRQYTSGVLSLVMSPSATTPLQQLSPHIYRPVVSSSTSADEATHCLEEHRLERTAHKSEHTEFWTCTYRKQVKIRLGVFSRERRRSAYYRWFRWWWNLRWSYPILGVSGLRWLPSSIANCLQSHRATYKTARVLSIQS